MALILGWDMACHVSCMEGVARILGVRRRGTYPEGGGGGGAVSLALTLAEVPGVLCGCRV